MNYYNFLLVLDINNQAEKRMQRLRSELSTSHVKLEGSRQEWLTQKEEYEKTNLELNTQIEQLKKQMNRLMNTENSLSDAEGDAARLRQLSEEFVRRQEQVETLQRDWFVGSGFCSLFGSH